MPEISIIVPTYNRKDLLAKAIDSIKEQSYSDWELLVIDDCSTDGTEIVMDSLVEKDKRIHYKKLDIHCGHPSIPRNIGLELSKGKYIAFLDDDNYWGENHLFDLIEGFGKDDSLLYDSRCNIDIDGAQIIYDMPFNPARLKERNYIDISQVMFKRELYDKFGGFEERFGLQEDYGLWLKFMNAGIKFKHIGKVGTFYCHHHGQYGNRGMPGTIGNNDNFLVAGTPPQVVQEKCGVALCIPTLGMVSIEFAMHFYMLHLPINVMMQMNFKTLPFVGKGNKFQLRVAKGREVGFARNELVKSILNTKPTPEYILFLDDDVLVPPNLLGKLMSEQKDIIGGVYFSKGSEPAPLIFNGIGNGYVHYKDWIIGDIIQCTGIGMGATLIKTDVFRNIPEPWFFTEHGIKKGVFGINKISGTEDIWFCKRAIEVGYKIFADTSLQCAHVNIGGGTKVYLKGNIGEYGKVIVESLRK